MATLYIVGTPIGNMEDMSYRAVRILREVSVIYSEDTRVTGELCKRYEITTRRERFDAHVEQEGVAKIIETLESGQDIALVTDAGTPAISDPGMILVALVRARIEKTVREGQECTIRIESVPGPSAVTTALSIAGVPCASFAFHGFIPHKKGRQTLFGRLALSHETDVLYESPHRLDKTLESLTEVLPPERHIAVVKELSKIYEQVIRGQAGEVLQYFVDNPDRLRGEFVLIVYTPPSLDVY